MPNGILTLNSHKNSQNTEGVFDFGFRISEQEQHPSKSAIQNQKYTEGVLTSPD